MIVLFYRVLHVLAATLANTLIMILSIGFIPHDTRLSIANKGRHATGRFAFLPIGMRSFEKLQVWCTPIKVLSWTRKQLLGTSKE